MTAHRRNVNDRFEELVAYIAPSEWFDDDHREGKHPRCCALRDALIETYKGMLAVCEETR